MLYKHFHHYGFVYTVLLFSPPILQYLLLSYLPVFLLTNNLFLIFISYTLSFFNASSFFFFFFHSHTLSFYSILFLFFSQLLSSLSLPKFIYIFLSSWQSSTSSLSATLHVPLQHFSLASVSGLVQWNVNTLMVRFALQLNADIKNRRHLYQKEMILFPSPSTFI